MSDCLNCSEYDKEKNFCPKWCDVIKNTIEDARADERRKFAEWLAHNRKYNPMKNDIGFVWSDEAHFSTVDEVLAEYEKELKK